MFWHGLSVCSHLGGYPGQVQMGGYPCRGVPTLGTPLGAGQGVPCQGYPTLGTPHQTWLGCTLSGGYPTLGTSLLDLAGGTLPEGTLLGVPYWGVPPPRVTDGVLDTPRSVCLLRPRRRTFLFILLTFSVDQRKSNSANRMFYVKWLTLWLVNHVNEH